MHIPNSVSSITTSLTPSMHHAVTHLPPYSWYRYTDPCHPSRSHALPSSTRSHVPTQWSHAFRHICHPVTSAHPVIHTPHEGTKRQQRTEFRSQHDTLSPNGCGRAAAEKNKCADDCACTNTMANIYMWKYVQVCSHMVILIFPYGNIRIIVILIFPYGNIRIKIILIFPYGNIRINFYSNISIWKY